MERQLRKIELMVLLFFNGISKLVQLEQPVFQVVVESQLSLLIRCVCLEIFNLSSTLTELGNCPAYLSYKSSALIFSSLSCSLNYSLILPSGPAIVRQTLSAMIGSSKRLDLCFQLVISCDLFDIS